MMALTYIRTTREGSRDEVEFLSFHTQNNAVHVQYVLYYTILIRGPAECRVE
ncbi:predicted protein [Botrytis cinerea T4]|uniref:Uncharacterized protein n=1 Tax=Botryotinia fuckeliana (strain T4) TaxID=999810 RepID=G2YW10_BOTF4|nr:predicted protein [Botrytis cinerea T4]